MKKIFLFLSFSVLLFSCKNSADKEKFTVAGEIKNTPDQKIFLEELYFSQKPPEVLDTAQIKNGKFSSSAIAHEMGLYRLRLEKTDAGFIFINDEKNIPFAADLTNLTINSPAFNTPANKLLKHFMVDVDLLQTSIADHTAALQQLKTTQSSDSILNAQSQLLNDKKELYKTYIIHYIDTTSNPIMAMIAIGHTREIESAQLEKPIASLIKRFPKNETIASVVAQFNELVARKNAQPHIGGIAPEINLPDTSGKLFSLSSLRGKYVLIDFWASWCGPCRAENPNVVEAFNKFKDKNFTVLGVSLDRDKEQWINAINADKLSWKHVSDLKFWNSAAVALYGFDGIPYNVLIDPQGKIIATELKGSQLIGKLSEVIK
jgi:peroxiredoxin